MAGMAPATQAAALNSMAPYDKMVSPNEFYNGAMLDLKPTGDAGEWIRTELRTMKNEFNINTVTSMDWRASGLRTPFSTSSSVWICKW